jgi:hypothetical protein
MKKATPPVLGQPTGGLSESASPWSRNGIPESEIREHLDAILRSKAFLSSRRCSGFLRYVVEHALAGDEMQLKEAGIAKEVFSRTSVQEGIEDSVVRVCAREVRKRLERYYSDTGAQDAIRIQLPVGSYVPHFCRPPQPPPATAPSELATIGLEAMPPRSRTRPKFILAGCCALLLIAAILAGEHLFSGPPGFGQFWAPITGHPRPALVCIGPTLVYGFSRRMHESFLRQNPAALSGGRELFQFPPGTTIPAEDLIPFTDDRFTSGAFEAAIRMAQLLERTGKAAQFRLSDTISQTEAREQPIILIGAFSNVWTLEWSRNLRYYFHREIGKDGVRVSIRDRQDANRSWSIPYLERGNMTVDYAVVARVTDPVTRNPVIAIAGLTHYGTQAAAAFVTDRVLLDHALRGAPSGWPSRDYEAVLETAVINRTPSRTQVLTQTVW